MTASPSRSLYKKSHPEPWVHLLHFMSEQLGYMPHLSTLMLTINLVNIYSLLPIVETFGPEVRIVLYGHLIKWIWLVFLLFSLSLPLCIFLLLIVNSGVEAGKKAAGEVLALQKRVLAVLNEARYNVKSLVVLPFIVSPI